MAFLIYKITNMINVYLYIGSTTNLEMRWRQHVGAASHKRQPHSPLYAAMREYGIDKFTIELIEECPDVLSMQRKEFEYIQTLSTIYPNGYNLRKRTLTDGQAAIIKFDVYGWTKQQYADFFGLSRSSITILMLDSSGNPYHYITREHLKPTNDHQFSIEDVFHVSLTPNRAKSHEKNADTQSN